MVPPDNDVFITNGLIFKMSLERKSELSVVPELLDVSPELISLNESSFLPQEMIARLKREIKIL